MLFFVCITTSNNNKRKRYDRYFRFLLINCLQIIKSISQMEFSPRGSFLLCSSNVRKNTSKWLRDVNILWWALRDIFANANVLSVFFPCLFSVLSISLLSGKFVYLCMFYVHCLKEVKAFKRFQMHLLCCHFEMKNFMVENYLGILWMTRLVRELQFDCFDGPAFSQMLYINWHI